MDDLPIRRSLDRFEAVVALRLGWIDRAGLESACSRLEGWLAAGRECDLAEAVGEVAGLTQSDLERIRDEAKADMLADRRHEAVRIERAEQMGEPQIRRAPGSPVSMLLVLGSLVIGVGLIAALAGGPSRDRNAGMASRANQISKPSSGHSGGVLLTGEGKARGGFSGDVVPGPSSLFREDSESRIARFQQLLTRLDRTSLGVENNPVFEELLCLLQDFPELAEILGKRLESGSEQDRFGLLVAILVLSVTPESSAILRRLALSPSLGTEHRVEVLEAMVGLRNLTPADLQVLRDLAVQEDEVLLEVSIGTLAGLARRLRIEHPGRAGEILQFLHERVVDAHLVVPHRATLLRALGSAGNPGSIEVIARHLEGEEPLLRAAAVGALGGFSGDPRVFEHVVRRFREDDDEGVVFLAGRILGELDSARAGSIFRQEFYRSTNPAVRAYALSRLAQEQDDSETRNWLQEIARTDEDPEMRELALDLLGRANEE